MNKKFKQSKQEYIKKLKDPRWQKKRLEVLARDEFTCQSCDNQEETLHVHHKIYQSGKEPWDYDIAYLITLCETCHYEETLHIKSEVDFLVLAVKKVFLSEHINCLARGIFYMTDTFVPPQEIAYLLEAFLTKEELFGRMVQIYWEWREERTKLWEEKQKIELIVDNC